MSLNVNKKQAHVVLSLLKSKYKLKNLKVTVLGLAFKAHTDDMRESPSVAIVEGLIKAGASISAFDPEALENSKKIFGDKITYSKTKRKALKGSELAIILTEWDEFKTLDFDVMKKPRVFDTRKILNTDLMPENVEYEGLAW